ncbi:MAG: M20/M25/M40 family metallo-hydrolase [Acidobacteria bacterium]|nr:MAG: M20/M25/M40 family metallo-hydrolase [Acidobacteriota bacterium]
MRLSPTADRWAAAGCLIALVLVAALQILLQAPPRPETADAPAREFSAARTLALLQSWDRAPHSLGTAAHDAVRDGILAQLRDLGLQGTVHAGTSYLPLQGPHFDAGYVENITAVLPGTEPAGKAVMLVAHYDSVPRGPGAGDDGANVAAMLETLRALRAGSPLRHDVIALFSDGEEAGMLGAARFVAHDPLRPRVGVVVNFEGRGNAGPSYMFETSRGNSWLVHEFAAAHTGANASSLMYAIYQRLPNDTDLSVFKHAGLAGLNFAYTGGFDYYHSPLDSPANLSLRTLQNQGHAMLAMARTLGNADLNHPRGHDRAYFAPVGHALVTYSFNQMNAFALLAILLFIAACIVGITRKAVSGGSLLAGAGIGLLVLLACAVSGAGVWTLLQWLHPGWRWIPQGQPYRPVLLGLAILAWALLVASVIYNVFGRRVRAAGLGLGALLWLLVSAVALAEALPGGAFGFLWPLLALLAAWIVIFFAPGAGERAAFRQGGLLGLGALPLALLLAPLTWMFLMLLPWAQAGAGLAVFALVLIALSPYLVRLGWKLTAAALALCMGLGVAGLARNGLAAQRAQPDSIVYREHWKGTQATARWVSYDPAPDTFTAQFLGARPARDGRMLTASAPALPLPPPTAQIESDTAAHGFRTLWLHFASLRGAETLSVELQPGMIPLGAVLNGEAVRLDPPSKRYPADGIVWGFAYHGLTPAGIDLVLTLRAGQRFRLTLTDALFGLPPVPGMDPKPRAAWQTSAPFERTDESIVSADYRF